VITIKIREVRKIGAIPGSRGRSLCLSIKKKEKRQKTKIKTVGSDVGNEAISYLFFLEMEKISLCLTYPSPNPFPN